MEIEFNGHVPRAGEQVFLDIHHLGGATEVRQFEVPASGWGSRMRLDGDEYVWTGATEYPRTYTFWAIAELERRDKLPPA